MTTDYSGAVTTGDRTPMDAALKAKWIEALRSGEYPQGNHELHGPKGYCCLGVLCVIAGLEIDKLHDRIVGAKTGCVDDRYAPLKALIGIDNLYQFSTRNDGGYLTSGDEDAEEVAPHTFAQLADYIEANVESSAVIDDRSHSDANSVAR